MAKTNIKLIMASLCNWTSSCSRVNGMKEKKKRENGKLGMTNITTLFNEP